MRLIAVTAGQRYVQQRIAGTKLMAHARDALDAAELLGRQADLMTEQTFELPLAERDVDKQIGQPRAAGAGGDLLKQLLHRGAT